MYPDTPLRGPILLAECTRRFTQDVGVQRFGLGFRVHELILLRIPNPANSCS